MIFLFFKASVQSIYTKINGSRFLGIKADEVEADHSFPSIDQVKKS